jgi:hypothetical protein
MLYLKITTVSYKFLDILTNIFGCFLCFWNISLQCFMPDQSVVYLDYQRICLVSTGCHAYGPIGAQTTYTI